METMYGLNDLFRGAADDNTHTPIRSCRGSISSFWHWATSNILRELCASVFRTEGVYDGPEYTECFKFRGWEFERVPMACLMENINIGWS